MRILLPALLALASCGISQGHTQHHSHGKRNNATQLPEFTSSPQLPKNSSSALRPLYEAYSKSKPKFENEALIRQLSQHLGERIDNLDYDSGSLSKRDLPTGTCAPGVPCTNGACCSSTGVCSYAPSSCGADVCISNCDAKAPCGEYANPDNATCPLNVCCSQYGFCGSTDDFCGTGCQEGYGGCGDAPTPSCSSGSSSASARRIGYYESWATERPCDVFTPEDLELTGLTHINFAFSFFDPSTFQISPMDSNAASLYSRFTALKSKQPGLQAWLSVGGWSFNDATNTPDTQHAFSDMVGSSANRQAFITSLRNFMQTYGFDGVDIDWEYPAADDRGGVAADFSNFPTFLAELRASFGSALGISTTLPSSYWYLQHFDVLNMEPSVDWFNFMSYDIHGVWDSSNKFTGPYIRPHTNLTEINDGLSLLWRAGVDSSKVVLGLGWYGRSFTLADSSCTTPNGVCQFTTGGNAGACTQSSGTLSNAEIKRLLAAGTGTESYDATAGVRWLTFDSNQWVSFDDGVTMQQKITFANSQCLGGVMIWSIDQDNTAGESMNDLMGIGTANGVSEAAAASFKEQMSNATLQNAVASSCYWSLCGDTCTTGYFDVTDARGQIAGYQSSPVCSPGESQTLCCAPGTSMGTCQWEGWRGVGMPCSPACSDPDATIVARNTNSYVVNDGGQLEDLTCTGGYQAYCCTGFVPSSLTNSGNLNLYGQTTTTVSKRDGSKNGLVLYAGGSAVEKRTGLIVVAGELGALCLADAIPSALGALVTFGLSLAGEGVICAASALAGLASAAIIGWSILSSIGGWLFGGSPSKPNVGVPTTVAGRSSYGQWQILDFSGGTTTSTCDCAVTYTCRYGMGWDEICDNQRWGINKLLNGRTVYQPLPTSRAAGANQALWRGQRISAYRSAAQVKLLGSRYRCEVDEFPMGNLAESGNKAPQACRLVNGPANGNQGNDFKMWKWAQWQPCSAYRSTVCKISDDGPPATWAFGPLAAGRGSGSGKHFIDAYGFDDQTAGSSCWATYTYTDSPGVISTSTVVDHGFRVLDDDPMYGNAYGWPRQSWRVNPAPIASQQYRPYDSQPSVFQRRDLLGNGTWSEEDSDPAGVCHADLRLLGNGKEDVYPDLDYDNLLFVDLEGNPVDGRTCNVIYEDDDPHSELRLILNEEGHVVDMYMGDAEAGSWTREALKGSKSDTVTVDPTTVTVTTGVAAGSESRPTFPASTIGVQTGSGTLVTPAPYVYGL
ncbi:CAZyme family GH18 [Penicillium verhagenii]|uniref:CAZyme family GH18 n=1 Tax=Penicillium verhagenii TaxID=1562060 RepID=UPI002544E2C8|nr:CAZyme family GH18 [Penicillium verhagenii]KAJ5921194.1 CAZyme family GH18 [Penicillium verhagenii]